MDAFGSALATPRLFGNGVAALRTNGIDLWRHSKSTPSSPAGADYVHSLWGDTSKLTRPPALVNPLIVTDYERGRPGAGFSETGPDGQTITGSWVTIGQETGCVNHDGTRYVDSVTGWTNHPNDPVQPNRPFPAGTWGPFAVWRLEINGNGGDVWLQANRPGGVPTPIDFSIRIVNVRHLRVTGLDVDLPYEETVRGYPFEFDNSAQDGGLTGNSRTVGRHDVLNYAGNENSATSAPGSSIFIEGCNFDYRNRTWRTDHFSFYGFGLVDNPADLLCIQNSAFVNAGNSILAPGTGSHANSDGPNHADIVHFEARTYVPYVHFENFYATTNYQGIFAPYNQAHWRGGNRPQYPNGDTMHMHFRFYNTDMWIRGGSTGAKTPLFIHYTTYYAEKIASLEFNNCHWYRGSTKTNDFPELILPAQLTSVEGPGKVTIDTTYLNLRSNVPLRDGSTQAQMCNVDGGNQVELYCYADWASMDAARSTSSFYIEDGGEDANGDQLPGSAPNIGASYTSIWDEAGDLLEEA